MKKVECECHECGRAFLSSPFRENVVKRCPKCGSEDTSLA